MKHQKENPQFCEGRFKPVGEVMQASHVAAASDYTPFPKDEVEGCVPKRFETIVRKYSDRIAVKTGKETVTYAQLNTMANRVAHAIVEQRGASPEAVAILAEKGPWLMAAMLGD